MAITHDYSLWFSLLKNSSPLAAIKALIQTLYLRLNNPMIEIVTIGYVKGTLGNIKKSPIILFGICYYITSYNS